MQQPLFDRYGPGVDAGQDHHAGVPPKADGNGQQCQHQESCLHRSIKKPPWILGGFVTMFEAIKARLRLEAIGRDTRRSCKTLGN